MKKEMIITAQTEIREHKKKVKKFNGDGKKSGKSGIMVIIIRRKRK